MTLPCQHMVPKMDKFCWTFDLDKGVKYGAMFLMGCWILYAIIAASCGIEIVVWTINWAIFNLVMFTGIIYGVEKKRLWFILAGLLALVVTVCLGCINFFINFVVCPLAGVSLMLITGLMAYFSVTVASLYIDLLDEQETDKNSKNTIHINL